jgi:2-C-methyl-D-erythritol 2,4-cyclodiphosphate synthase
MKQRAGIGFDVHRFADDRKLVLGGVHIPFPKGLAGHSDADVVLHAICDAMLGALSLGDIGKHFPDTDTRFKDISSRILLEKTYDLVKQEGYELVNLDVTVLLEKPKISPYIDQMCKNIADILWCKISAVSVKATTTESLGFTGRGEGAGAMAVVLLRGR